LFSDPLCPLCVEDTPLIIKDVQNHPDIFSLYYISFPLDMHPTAKTIVKATWLAKKQKIKDIEYKVYTANFDKYFDAYDNKDDQKSLDAFNKVLKTNITMKQIKSKQLEKQLKHELELVNKALVNGTPTLFTDGEIDLTRSQYKKYINE
jgi:protein-disulfide isomerase